MMRESLLFVLVVATFPSASWKAVALSVLNAPSSLKTGDVTEKSVVLEWDFRAPGDLPLSEVVFHVSLEGEQSFRLRYKTKPLNHTFENLFAGKVYIASVVATASNRLDSPPAEISFTTLKKDWTTPEIRSVIRTPRRDIAQYNVTWFKLPLSSLSHVVVEVCDSSCASYTEEARAVSILVPVEFDSKFSIRVCVFYNVDVVGPIERCSEYFQGTSARAPPEEVLKMKNVRKVGNKIQLDWHPILPPDGPRSYYDFLVRDPHLGPEYDIEDNYFETSLRVLAVTDTDFELRFIDKEYERMLRAIFCGIMDQTDVETGEEASEQDEPLQLKIMRKTQRTLRFKILFRTGENSFGFDEATRPRHLLLWAKNFTFSSYKPIEFLVRSCLTYDDDALGLCGNFTAARIISSVHEPSPVPYIGYEFRSDGGLEIFWRAPEKPRGPIDGYKLRIQQKLDDGIDTRILTIAPHLRSFLIKDAVDEAQYHIGIAAFNVDRENNDEQLFSMWVYTTPVRSKINLVLLVLIIAICASVIALSISQLLDTWQRNQEKERNRDQEQEQEPEDTERTMISSSMHSSILDFRSG